MSYRNFTKKEITIEILDHPQFETLVSLTLAPQDRHELVEALIEVKNLETKELRVDFASLLTLFFKIREGESRLLVARPELNTCVGTLALSASHLSLLIDQLKNSNTVDVRHLETVNRMSNFEVRIQ